MNSGCWSKAKAALIIDCMPVSVPKWLAGYLEGMDDRRNCLGEH